MEAAAPGKNLGKLVHGVGVGFGVPGRKSVKIIGMQMASHVHQKLHLDLRTNSTGEGGRWQTRNAEEERISRYDG